MTPSHHGLGSVILCTVGRTPSRWTCGTSPARAGSAAIARHHRPGGGPRRAAERVRAGPAPADAGRARHARRRECRSRSTPPSASRSARSPAPRRPATSRRWLSSTASGTWSSTCVRSPAAARTPPTRTPEPTRRPPRRNVGHRARTRLARRAALGHLVVFSAETSQTEAHPLAYALSAAQVVEVTFVPEIAPIPMAPPHVRGLCDWRGRPLLVVDLPARLMTDHRQHHASGAAHRLPPRQLARPVRRAGRSGHPDGPPAHRPRTDRAGLPARSSLHANRRRRRRDHAGPARPRAARRSRSPASP